MPRSDATGPTGQGPMTGRGVGACATDPTQPAEGIQHGWGAGYGRGRRGRGGGGGGGGWRNRFCATGSPGLGLGRLSADADFSPKEELEVRKDQIQRLSEAVQRIQGRIDELEAAPSEKEE